MTGSNGPVFIVGLPRSGTKLLRALLDNHPALFIPPYETECLPWLIRHTPAGGWQGEAGFTRLWAAIRPLPFFGYLAREGLPLAPAAWQAQCRSRDAAGVFDGLLRAVAALRGETGWTVWGDKSPSHIGHIDSIARHFPTARFIHIVRDVRDVASSARRAWGKHPVRTAQRWRDEVLRVHAQAASGRLPLLEVRFEDLVADPEATLQPVMAFLGLPFQPAQLALPEGVEDLGSARGQRSVQASAAGTYRREFSAAQLAAIERVAADAMAQYGYATVQYHGPQRALPRWRMGLLRCTDAVQLVRHRMRTLGLWGAIGFYWRYNRFSGNRVAHAHPLLMLGTGLQTRGGIASVVRLYRDSGLFARAGVDYLATHGDGPSWYKAWLALRAFVRLCWQLPQRRYRLVHVHLSARSSFWRKYLLLLPVRLWRRPYVLHLHGSEFREFHDAESPAWVQRCIRRLFDRAAAIVVLSASWQHWVQGMSANPRVMIIPNAVPLPAAVSARQAGQLLFLGRLGERKGIYTLLDALALLRPQFLALRLVCAGDGEIDAVRARVQALGLQDCVTVPGWIDADTRQRLLAQASVLVLPSHNEGLPMAVLEAMAAGLAVVATPVGGIPEAVVDGETGLLVPPGDAAALAQALRTLLADPARLARLGDAARARIAGQFSPAASEARLQALWQQVAA